MAWYPVGILPDDPSYGGGTAMTSVAATWFGEVAVGYGPAGGRTWWSTDGGRSWYEAQYPEPSLRFARLQAVAASPDVIVAVGTVGGAGETRPGLWTSRDGVSWTAGALSSEEATGYVTGVTWTGTVFVAIGRGGSDDDAAIWRSPDGRTWTTQDLGNADPLGVVSGPAGTIAWGTTFEGTWTNTGWSIGTDGGQAVPFEIDHAITNLAATPSGFVALEPATPTGYTVLRSPDGHSWAAAGNLDLATIGGFTARPDGTVVAAGTTADDVLHVFESRDGGAWVQDLWPAPPEDQASILGALPTEAGIVGVGTTASNRVGAWLAIKPGDPTPLDLQRDPVPTGCPADDVAASPTLLLADLYRLTPSERLGCFGNTTLHLRGYLATPDGLGGTCGPEVATPDWLTGGCLGYPAGWLESTAAPFGSATALEVFARGAVADALTSGRWVDVAGHFDDGASSTCRLTNPNTGLLVEPATTSIASCRRHFVVSSVTWIKAPPEPSANADPAGIVNALPATFRLSPATGGWDNLRLPDGTTWGFRGITPLGGAAVGATVFRAPNPANVPALASALAGSIGPTTSEAIDGVMVSWGSGGLEAEFAVGLRVYDLSVEAGGTDSLRAVVRALIAAG
jgi:hypothetical protein